MGRFIVIEGVDGVGKSSLVKGLSETLSAVSICTPSQEEDAERKRIEASNCQQDILNFYILSLKKMQSLLHKTLWCRDVVCDRYLLSTIAYQWPKNTDCPTDPYLIFSDLLRPDLTLLLYASSSVRARRIQNREALSGVRNPNDYKQQVIERAAKRFISMENIVCVNTGDLTKKEVLNFSLSKVAAL